MIIDGAYQIAFNCLLSRDKDNLKIIAVGAFSPKFSRDGKKEKKKKN